MGKPLRRIAGGGVPVDVGNVTEYARVYRRFAELPGRRTSVGSFEEQVGE